MTSPPERPSRRAGDLFRPEAVAEQQDRWLGTVLLVPKVSHTVYAGFAALVVAGVLGLFAFGEYTRKARIGGWLAPEQGLIQIVAPQPGVLTRLQAQEGLEVAAGTPLAVLSAERQQRGARRDAGRGGAPAPGAARQPASPSASRHQALFAQQAATLGERLAVIEAEARDLEREVELQRDAARRSPSGRRRGSASCATAPSPPSRTCCEAEEDALDQAAGAADARAQPHDARPHPARARGGARRAAAARGDAARRDRPRHRRARAGAGRGRGGARDRHRRARGRARSPALRAASGSSVGPDAPLMTLVPAGARLEARLYGPSRAIGFVRPGQRVLLRYEAFPHQKFGQYEGVVQQRLAQHGRAGGARRRRGAAARASSPASRSIASPSSSPRRPRPPTARRCRCSRACSSRPTC